MAMCAAAAAVAEAVAGAGDGGANRPRNFLVIERVSPVMARHVFHLCGSMSDDCASIRT